MDEYYQAYGQLLENELKNALDPKTGLPREEITVIIAGRQYDRENNARHRTVLVIMRGRKVHELLAAKDGYDVIYAVYGADLRDEEQLLKIDHLYIK